MKIIGPIHWEKLSLESVERERFLDCVHYEECLSYAARKKWEGFSCRNCLLFKEERERRIKKRREKEKGEEMISKKKLNKWKVEALKEINSEYQIPPKTLLSKRILSLVRELEDLQIVLEIERKRRKEKEVERREEC